MADHTPLCISFQGTHGAYSEQAIRQHFGNGVTSLPCEHFAEILHAVESGAANYAMLPVENSSAGTVVPAYNELMETKLSVLAEVIAPVHHCLLAPNGLALEDIHTAYSHPQALAQCEQYLKQHGIQAEAFYDTAGAAKFIAEETPDHSAAIASSLAAEIHKLSIVDENIEDLSNNQTRFYVMGNPQQWDQEKSPNKAALIASLKHKQGSLHKALSLIAEHGFNLTKIESRPNRKTEWSYDFILDMESGDFGRFEDLLKALGKISERVKVLGCFVSD